MDGPTLLRPGGIEAAGVAGELDPRLRHLEPQVRLVHREVDRADALPLGHEQVEGGLDPVLTSHLGDLVEAQADVRLVLGSGEADRHDAVRTPARLEPESVALVAPLECRAHTRSDL